MTALGFGTGFRLDRRGKLAVGFDFTGGALPGATSLTRASAGTRCDASGAIASAAADVARFDYDPVGHAARGILVEPGATNLATWSQDWTQAAGWTPVAVSANAAAIIDDTTSAFHRYTGPSNSRSLTSGVAVTLSVIASERAGSAKRYLVMNWKASAFGTAPSAVFDLAAGTLTNAINCSAAIAAAPGGWLCSMAATPTSTAATNEFYQLSTDSSAAVAYQGDGASGLNVGEMQIEAGPLATSRIRSGASPGVRAADALTLPGPSGTWRFTFDDGSSQDVALIASGGVVSVPTNLNRARIARAALL